MENATKAMLIAAGVLIGVMILSLGAVLFSELEIYVESSHERMRFNELNAFNSQFTKYDRNTSTIQDVVTATNLAYQNNIDYNATEDERGDENSLYVAVFLDGMPIENEINQIADDLLQDNISREYTCTVSLSEVTGRVFMLRFTRKYR